ncbi:MAG: hypothetical protein KAR12_12690 [Methylococcales bacterium]|nr:hypothetical protein [Methylococcales bacterium]
MKNSAESTENRWREKRTLSRAFCIGKNHSLKTVLLKSTVCKASNLFDIIGA